MPADLEDRDDELDVNRDAQRVEDVHWIKRPVYTSDAHFGSLGRIPSITTRNGGSPSRSRAVSEDKSL